MTDSLKARMERLHFFSVNADTERYFKASDIFALLDEWCKSPEIVNKMLELYEEEMGAQLPISAAERGMKAALSTITGEK